MRERPLNRLSCPDDLSPLRLDISTQDTDGHVVHGQLKCRRCRRVYPIKQGVPDFVPDLSPKVAGDDLHELKSPFKCVTVRPDEAVPLKKLIESRF